MQYLADFLGINYDEVLLTPTFNKFPIKANTSFKAKQHGIMNNPLKRYETLTNDELTLINAMTDDLYEEVVNVCTQF
jgi:hypothetical protein